MTDLEQGRVELDESIDFIRPRTNTISRDYAGGISRNRDEALAAFDSETTKLLIEAETQLDPILANALILIEHREWEPAKQLLRHLLQVNPYDEDAILWLGHCLREQTDYSSAEQCFRQLARIYPKFTSYFELAEVLYVQQHDEPALATYLMALSCVEHETPMLFDLYKNVGNIYVRAGDFEAAEENYNKAYTLNPESDILMVNYGTLEIQRENYDEAVARYRAAVQICPSNDRGWVGLALIHRHYGDSNLAWANLECALDLAPGNVTALGLMIDWAIQDSRLNGALARLRVYVDRHGENATMVMWLAQLLLVAGQLEEANFEIQRALAQDPNLLEGEELAAEIKRQMQARRELKRD
jgi:tetratricopeptide (TPR) repeat protein